VLPLTTVFLVWTPYGIGTVLRSPTATPFGSVCWAYPSFTALGKLGVAYGEIAAGPFPMYYGWVVIPSVVVFPFTTVTLVCGPVGTGVTLRSPTATAGTGAEATLALGASASFFCCGSWSSSRGSSSRFFLFFRFSNLFRFSSWFWCFLFWLFSFIIFFGG